MNDQIPEEAIPIIRAIGTLFLLHGALSSKATLQSISESDIQAATNIVDKILERNQIYPSPD